MVILLSYLMKKEPQKTLCPQAHYCRLFKRLIRDIVKILVSWKPCTHYGNMILISKTCVLDWFSWRCPVIKFINEGPDTVPRHCTATANCSSEEDGPNAENKFHCTLFFLLFFVFILQLLCWVFTEKMKIWFMERVGALCQLPSPGDNKGYNCGNYCARE